MEVYEKKGGRNEQIWVGTFPTAQIVLTLLQVFWAAGAPVAFNVRPLVLKVPPEHTHTHTREDLTMPGDQRDLLLSNLKLN